MAAQKDVQDLLRLLTTGRNKLPMMAAMGRVKALQGANIRNIADIAASNLETLKAIVSNEKDAKALLAAAKAHRKSGDSTPGAKRHAVESLSSSAKRTKSAYELAATPQTPAEHEALLALPQPSLDEEAISKCRIYTNRAPLVLAFAVVLLKYTMPEQPLSSRLSLGQAVVSVNSKSKAVSLGIQKGKSADEEGWSAGQPKIRIMGREISILKRGGYEWREEEIQTKRPNEDPVDEPPESMPSQDSNVQANWTVSAPIILKQSHFIARSIDISSTLMALAERNDLLSTNAELKGASHNITAWRVQGDYGIIEGYDDDGESGGGRHLLGILQEDKLTNVLLLVTRWWGGVMLGGDRWRIMSQVSRDALSQRLRVAGVLGQEALWGLDLETMRSTNAPVTGGAASGMPIYRAESARAYILKSFGPAPTTLTDTGEEVKPKKKSGAVIERELEENLSLLLGALNLLFSSWVKHVSREELDRRAWGWYVQVRPEVEGGVAGWGEKAVVKLDDILKLRRTE